MVNPMWYRRPHQATNVEKIPTIARAITITAIDWPTERPAVRNVLGICHVATYEMNEYPEDTLHRNADVQRTEGPIPIILKETPSATADQVVSTNTEQLTEWNVLGRQRDQIAVLPSVDVLMLVFIAMKLDRLVDAMYKLPETHDNVLLRIRTWAGTF